MAKLSELTAACQKFLDALERLSKDGNFTTAEREGFGSLSLLYGDRLIVFTMQPAHGETSDHYDAALQHAATGLAAAADCKSGDRGSQIPVYDAANDGADALRAITAKTVNIGTIGHRGHGKTEVAGAVRKRLDERGGRGGDGTRDYSITDVSGDPDALEDMAKEAGEMDGTILVVDASKGVEAQTRDHVILARQVGVPSPVVFINKADMVDDEALLAQVEMEVRDLLTEYDWDGEDVPVIRGSAKGGGVADNIDDLLDAMDRHVADPPPPVMSGPPPEMQAAPSSGDVPATAAIGAAETSAIAFYYATSRQPTVGKARFYDHRRATALHYGRARVHVPEDRKFGEMKRPKDITVFGITLKRGKEDPKTHFIIESVEELEADAWRSAVASHGRGHALIFVHGFNNSFEDALYRAGQIFWDLQYDGLPVLYSWAAGGRTVDYVYDKDSAIHGGAGFRQLLSDLAHAGIERVHIVAHSMGNYMLMNALGGHLDTLGHVKFGEVVMAAPDVDRDLFLQGMPALMQAIPGLTLYASSADRALLASMKIARDVPRAGFVSDDMPVLLDGIDVIDVSDIGAEPFGLGHGAFSKEASILNDVGALLSGGTRPPHKRLAQLRKMPRGTVDAKWWKFAKGS
ncbi:MAG: alpha/beta hydrolase [Pacificimonas sp.]